MAENLREKLDRIDLKCIDENLRFYDLRSLFEATAPRLSPEDKEEVKKVIQNTDDAETIAAVLMAKAGDKNESLEEDTLDEALYNYYMIDFKDVDDGRRYSEEYSGWDSKDALEMFRIDYPESEGYKILAIYKLTDEGYERIDSLFDEFLEEVSYGGAYDIEDDMYFTKEELMEFGYDLAEQFSAWADDKCELSNVYMTSPVDLVMEVVESDGAEHQAKVKIDMRKIRLPRDIEKYTDTILKQWKDSYNEYHDYDESLNESSQGVEYLEDELADKSQYPSIEDAYQRNELTICKFKDRDVYYIQSCPNRIYKLVRREMKKYYPELNYLYDESLSEDTVKQGNKWVNKGKEGTHGKFATKKAADAQRKAMFASGYQGESLEEAYKHLSNREKQVYIDIINNPEECEDIDDLKDIVHEIFFYDKALFAMMNKFPKDASFEELKANKIAILKDSMLDESLNEDLIISPEKEYQSKSGHRILIKDVTPYISEYDGTANLRIKYDYKLAGSDEWGSSECNQYDLFKMLNEDWNIEDQIDAPETIGKLNPGDKFKNRNGVEITIVEPQKDGTIQYKIGDEIRAGSERSIQRMLYKNNYLRIYESFKEDLNHEKQALDAVKQICYTHGDEVPGWEIQSILQEYPDVSPKQIYKWVDKYSKRSRINEDYNSFLTLADNDANKLRNEYDKGDKSIFDILTSLNYVQDDPDSVYMYKEVSDGYAIVFDLSSYDEGKNYVKYFVVDENNNIPKGYTITKLLIEDYQHDKDEWGDPYSYDEVERELKNITNDWTDEEGTIRCYWEQEKNYGMQILQKHYDIVEPSDGRTGSGEEMSWVLAYSRPKEELKESLNESVTSNLQDKIIDCLDWFILMEMEFPKDKFLADSWEDVKDGIQMGIDPEFEVAEGIIEYLKPIITFNKKYNKEVGEEGVFQDEIEMYQSLVRAMNNYLAKNGYEDRIEEDFSFEDNVTQMKDLMGQNSDLFNKMIDDVETPKKDNRIFKFLKRKEK